MGGMRKEYGEALRDTFDRELKAKLPAFTPLKTGSKFVFPGERVYHRALREQIFCLIILIPSRKDTDEFTIEIGWSKQGRFPESGLRPSLEPPSPARTEFDQAEYVCRLSGLWGGGDFWWPVGAAADLDPLNPEDQIAWLMAMTGPISPQQARTAVQGSVEDAIGRITTYAVPYLDEFVDSQGSL